RPFSSITLSLAPLVCSVVNTLRFILKSFHLLLLCAWSSHRQQNVQVKEETKGSEREVRRTRRDRVVTEGR
ncbi:Uncharacterized protein DAT39_011305, partial [Clarias magur]